MGGHVARMTEKMNVYRISFGKPEVKIPVGRPRHRWVDNLYKGGWILEK
jgi:hypothetical protein